MAAPNRTSSRDERLQRLAYINELMPQTAQQPLPQAPQSDVLGQMMQMYKLQQDMEMQPLRQRAAEAEASVLENKASGQVQPRDILDFYGRTLNPLPPELQHLVQTPQSQAAVSQARATKIAAQQADNDRKAREAAATGAAGASSASPAYDFIKGLLSSGQRTRDVQPLVTSPDAAIADFGQWLTSLLPEFARSATGTVSDTTAAVRPTLRNR